MVCDLKGDVWVESVLQLQFDLNVLRVVVKFLNGFFVTVGGESLVDGGSLSYIERPEQALIEFTRLFNRLQSVRLTNAFLQLELDARFIS